MSTRLLPLGILLCLTTFALSQETVNDRAITIRSSSDLALKRQALIELTWGEEGMPLTKLPRLPVISNDQSPVRGLADLERVDTLTVDMEAGIRSYAHHLIPRWKNGRLVILHSGHIASFDDSEVPADTEYGMRRTIEALLSEGYSVLAVYMPLNADFRTSIHVSENHGGDAHNVIYQNKKFRPQKGSPMKYFLEPMTAYLNYLSTRSAVDGFPEYRDFSMVGFSGGGWTTTVYAALDTRIKLSISVAGSLPLYLRAGMGVGDAEQTDPAFYSIVGYPDLYVMGSDGPGRKQIQILNRNDWCCFSEVHHDPAKTGVGTFDEGIQEFESNVRQALVSLGNKDLFTVEVDEAAPGHVVSWDAIYDTIIPELSGGHRSVGTASGDEAIARGVNGTPAVFINGIWSPSKLAPMIGVPALLKGSVNIYDMFYRTTSNRLVHVSCPPLTWSRAQVLLENVISDPAAASRKSGSYDVVVLGKDYRVYHISRDGAQSTVEAISDDIKGLGQLTLIASSATQLDLFYRSWNRRLYHARKIDGKPWVITDVGGRMTDFPTAVKLSDGGFKVFVRGMDGGLWENQLGVGKNSFWSGWYKLPGASVFQGSPSASMIDGKVNVVALTSESNMRKFVFEPNWSITDQPGSYTGSPTASPRGIFARDADGTLNYTNGTEWTQLGGSLD